MTPRLFVDRPLTTDEIIELPATAARHVQVLRMQPGAAIALFNSAAGQPEGQFDAVITQMGRSNVAARVAGWQATARESVRAVHLAVGMPANERMDWLVEKATELGVASIRPLMTERSVLRLTGERADKKTAHWRGVAIAACEQCGRNRVPLLHAPANLHDWLATPTSAEGTRLLLSLHPGGVALAAAVIAAEPKSAAITFLSGPEGGLSLQEDAAARTRGFMPVTLGPRVLRAETAPLACLALLQFTEF